MKTFIGVTGPTGAGKGEVCRLFAKAGFGVVDCDAVAHKATAPGSPLISKLTEAFGQGICVDGVLDRKALARIAFASAENTERLNCITLPYIVQLVLEEAATLPQTHIVFDAPTLFESGLDQQCDCTVAVIAPQDIRLQRILSRDGIDEQAALLRIHAQHDDGYYTDRCTYTIRNDGQLDALSEQIDAILKKLCKLKQSGGTTMSEISKAEQLKQQLFYDNKNALLIADDAEIQSSYAFCEDYKTFLNVAKTEREATLEVIRRAEEQGFVPYDEKATYQAGDKVYVNNRDKAVILCVIGTQPVEQGVRIAVAHIDSPRLDLKPNPLYEADELALFKTHYYGGIKKYQWTCVPLSLHGVIIKQDGSKVTVRLGEDEGDPQFVVTDLLPHLGKEQSQRKLGEGITGEELNILVGSRPFKDDKAGEAVKLNIMNLLHEKYGIVEEDFLCAELEMVPAAKATDIGFDRSMIGSYGHDDRVCAYPEMMAAFEVAKPTKTTVTIFADKEETGSEGNTGLNSAYLQYFIHHLAKMQGGDAALALSRSECLSADVNAAYDPTFANVYEKRNSSFINHGAVITKYTGARGKSGTSDASAEFMGKVRAFLTKAGVHWQAGELGKVDEGGGGTVAMFIAKLGVDVVDLGVPVLSMHAPFEVVSKYDVYSCYRAVKAFFEQE